MKILQIITELGGGGAEKVLADLCCGLHRAGHRTTVLSLLGEPADRTIPDRLQACGAEIIYLNGRKYDPLLPFRIRSVIRAVQPDLIHTHLIHPNLLSRPACTGMEIPLINTVHTAEKRFGKWFYFLLDRLTCCLADCITAVSPAAAVFQEQRLHLRPGTIRVIRNGADPVPPMPPDIRRKLRASLVPEDTTRVIGCVGRLDRMKGFDLLLDRLDAVNAVIPDGEKWTILIFGSGPLQKKLEQRIANGTQYSNLTVKLAGYRPDAPALMGIFDVFLSTSRCEGYGLAVAEAMCLGLPVVCNAADAVPELCRMYDGNAFLFDIQSDTTGSDMASKLLMASKCTPTCGKVLMPVDRMIRSYLALYRLLLKRNKAGGNAR